MNDPSSPPQTRSLSEDVATLRRHAAEQARLGQLSAAIATYRQVLDAAPDHPATLADLGRLAMRMGEATTAEALFGRRYEADPTHPEAADDLAQALREQARYEDAISVLHPILKASPAEPTLWNTLGTIVNAQGDSAAALIYFDETLRLAPQFAAARHNRSGVLMDQGQQHAALAECDAALAIAESAPGGGNPSEMAVMRVARAIMLLTLGRLKEGWAAYEARLDPALPNAPIFDIPCRRLDPEDALAGLRLLVVNEQGVGDEVMFATVIADLVQALGPHGRLTLTAEPRLIPLFARSFPTAQVIAHTTVHQEGRTLRSIPQEAAVAGCDAWTPIASMLARLRPTIESFAHQAGYLRPDPGRLAFWRSALATAPSDLERATAPRSLHVGLTWRSGLMNGARRRGYAPLPQWRDVLATPGVQWVNVQYGDCESEVAAAEAAFGIKFWRPPGLDLRLDLDDLAALAGALDLVIGAPNATTNLAAACGTATWFVTAPGGWVHLGAEGRHPWHPKTRMFVAPSFSSPNDLSSDDDGWKRTLATVAQALRTWTLESGVLAS